MSDPTPPPGGGDQYPPPEGYPPPQQPPSGYPPQQPPSGYPPPQGYPPQGYPPPQQGPGGYPPSYQQQPYGQPGYPAQAYGGPPSNQLTLMNGTTVTIADGGKRAIGRIIDAVIVGIVFGILYAIVIGAFIGTADTTFNETTGEFETTGLEGFGLVIVSTLLLLVAQILYEVAFVAVKGQTPGKMIIGTKVVNEATGELIGWGPAFMRWLPIGIGNLICGLGWLVYFTAFLDKSGRMQGWHDKWGHDVVIAIK